MTKICTKCKEQKPVILFSDSDVRKYSWCKSCTGLASKASYERNKEKHIAQGLITRRKYKETPYGRCSSLLGAARGRADKSGIPFTITHEWLLKKVEAGKCEVTGIPLDLTARSLGSGHRPPFGPSLDQILPNIGYTPENTQLVCWMYNSAKGTHSHTDVLTFVGSFTHVQ